MSQPPPYEVSSAQAPPDGQDDSKGPAPSPHQPLPYQPQLPNGPPTSGAPFVFHVYKAGGLWSKDDIVTGPDKTTIEFYLEFPPRLFSVAWDLTLHRGGKEGPPVLKITKGTFSPDFLVQFPNGWSTGVVKTGFSRSHEFYGWGGSERSRFKWKMKGLSGGRMVCVNQDTKVTVATWNRSTFSISKDGSLTIDAEYKDQVELILATGLAMEEWCREQRNNR